MEQKQLVVKGKVSVFTNNDDQNIKYYDFFTNITVNGGIFALKLKADSSTTKTILASALGLNMESSGISSKSLPLKAEPRQFNNDQGKAINYVAYFVDVPFNGESLKVNLSAVDSTAKALLSYILGISPSADKADVDSDLPF